MSNLDSLRGIISISGEIGSGKTAMALGLPGVRPKDMVMFNFDVKEVNIPGLRVYSFLGEQYGGTEFDMATSVHQALKEIEKGGVDVLILDAFEHFSASLFSWVDKYQSQLKEKWFGTGTWRNKQVLGHAKVYEAALLENLQKYVRVIFVINHMDYFYENEVQSTRKVPKISKAVDRISLSQFVLVSNHRIAHPAPAVLVTKQLPWRVYNEETGRVESLNILPPRLDVRCLSDWRERDYISVWDMIEHYIENPVLSRELLDYEVPDDEERGLLIDTMTPQEREQLRVATELMKMQQHKAMVEAVKEYIFTNPSAPAIKVVGDLRGLYPELTPSMVTKLKEQSGKLIGDT